MTKQNNLQSLFCGILFCLSITALVIACLAFTKKDGGKGEHYNNPIPVMPVTRTPAPTPPTPSPTPGPTPGPLRQPCCCAGGGYCFYATAAECSGASGTNCLPSTSTRCTPARVALGTPCTRENCCL